MNDGAGGGEPTLMKIEPFLLERWQSTWEHRVAINLSESGVAPLSVRELLDDTGDPLQEVLDLRLGYTQTNGSEELRRAIAALHPGADVANVIVTVGCAEANHVVTWSLVEPGDEVVVMLPNYMQIWGLARALGTRVREWRLHPDPASGRWRGDPDELRALVNEKTRMILITHPNNPTGSCLEAAELDEIARIASRVGAWVLADEVYRGAEIEEGAPETASMWGRYERTLVTGGLSKAYGLPGLRIGWAVGPAAAVEELWARRDYTTIAPAALSDRLAVVALGRRDALLERTRAILRRNLAIVEPWLDRHRDVFDYLTPQAGAMLYVAYRPAIGSTPLVERLRVEKDVLVVPGDHYGMDGYLRIGYGYLDEELEEGLRRIADLLADYMK